MKTITLVFTILIISFISIAQNPTLNVTLNAKLFIEGYYCGNGLMDNSGAGGTLFKLAIPNSNFVDVDTVFISAMNSNFPYEEIDKQSGILKTDGNISVIFNTSVFSGSQYYLKINHRNSLETWSANPVIFSSNTNYDFTTSSLKAFGNNLKNLGDGNFSIFSGDINQNGVISISDYTYIENKSLLFSDGYLIGDLTGDGQIESTDFSLIENNYEAILSKPFPFVAICSQIWMTKNLDVVTYRNGDRIPQVSDPSQWASLTTGAWCYYNNDPAMGVIYGKIYNWYAVNDPRGLAPDGWHIPTDAEWMSLVSCVGGSNFAGDNLKEAGTIHWTSPNIDANNSSGFTGLAGGLRGGNGAYINLGNNAEWWTSTEYNIEDAWDRSLSYNNSYISRNNRNKENGYYVRCLRD